MESYDEADEYLYMTTRRRTLKNSSSKRRKRRRNLGKFQYSKQRLKNYSKRIKREKKINNWRIQAIVGVSILSSK